MKAKVHARFFDGSSIKDISGIIVNRIPDECPLCHIKMEPYHLTGWLEIEDLQKVFKCTNSECQRLFIAYYYNNRGDVRLNERTYKLNKVAPIVSVKREFSDIINTISPQFSDIYNEAKEAEESGLMNICGAGYRKAIEFLIKDYIIKVKAQPEKEIKAKRLGKCIDDDIESKNIKKCAKRAVWIGNDETHYIRKWKDKDLEDLKDLIDVTLFWIESEYKTERYELDMPEEKG